MAHEQSDGDPTVLYKYVPADRAVAILPDDGNGALRATQPAALNDPLECATLCSAVYPSEHDEAREILDTLNWIVPERPLTISDVQLSRRQLGTQAWNDLFRRQLSRRFGVVSFSRSALHPLLWAHYADSGTGVAVGYRLSTLRTITSGYERLAAVEYSEEPPLSSGHVIFKDERNLHSIMLTKANYWQYEQEWRMTLELKNTVGAGMGDRNGHSINVCPVPNDAVSEVYYTERTPQHIVDTIDARIRNPSNRFRAIALQKLVLASDRYAYE